jgi:general nucleoside transport system ATP-binding protein
VSEPDAARAEHGTPALALRGVARRFGAVVALDGVSLIVRPGTVHALLGENGAGKTTLMRVAYGMTIPDAGTIEVHGVPQRLTSPAQAIAQGIGMVHQHFTLVPAMTVAENIALGGHGRHSPRDAARRVEELSALTGFALDPQAAVADLPVGAQQRVEIAKALSRRARVLVLDEPTGVLAPAEIHDLLAWLRRFVAEGNAAVLVTHKLREALSVADDVTVLRQGRVVLCGRADALSEATLTTAMIGAELARDAAPPTSAPREADTVFRAEHLSIVDASGIVRVRDASFAIAGGELVGVVGVEGSGQRELLRALAGRLAPTGGTLVRPDDVGVVPEDRHHDAVLLDRPLTENVALRGAGVRRGLARWRTARARTATLMAEFDVRADGPDVVMRNLSGGNQQKLVLARELSGGEERGGPPRQHILPDPAAHHHPSIARSTASLRPIVAENPTRGLDVRAAADVHARLREAAQAGAAVVMYSSDLDEVLALASRVLVMFDGRLRDLPPDRDGIGEAMLGLDGPSASAS